MGEIHDLFVLALSMVWSAGATPDPCCRTLAGLLFDLAKSNPGGSLGGSRPEGPGTLYGIGWGAQS